MHSRFLLGLTPLLFITAHAVDCDNAADQATMNRCASQQPAAVDKEFR